MLHVILSLSSYKLLAQAGHEISKKSMLEIVMDRCLKIETLPVPIDLEHDRWWIMMQSFAI